MTSHGRRKNHGHGVSKLSPAGVRAQKSQISAIEPPERGTAGSAPSTEKPKEVSGAPSTISKDFAWTDEPQQYGLWAPQANVTPLHNQAHLSSGPPNSAASIESPGSPAVTSLKRLSEVGIRGQSDGSPHALGLSHPLESTIEWFKPSSEAISKPHEHSADNQNTSRGTGRRRSSAFRNGDRRRPEKDIDKAAVSGLKLPATITLRKATGLFATNTISDATSDTVSDESPTSRHDSLDSPTKCALIAFDSQQFDDPVQITTPYYESQSRKNSVVSVKGLELGVKAPTANGPKTTSSWQQAGAAPVVTVADIYPSPAILASPIKTTSSTDHPERRYSVVKINSRKSVHRVIWCEDDGSCSSGASSVPVSPTAETPAESVESISPSENSPGRTLSASRVISRQNSERTLFVQHSFPPNALVENESNAPSSGTTFHPEGQIFQFLWDADKGSPKANPELNKPFQSASQRRSQEEYLPEMVSWVPRLMIPDNEEPTAASGEPTIVRRGSFMMDPSLRANIGAGREIGSRRSISVQPLMLSRLGIQGAKNDEDENPAAARRQSRVA